MMKKIISIIILLGAMYFFLDTDTNGYSIIQSSANGRFYVIILYLLVASLGVILATDFDKMNSKKVIIKILLVVCFGIYSWYIYFVEPIAPFYKFSSEFSLIFYLVVIYLVSYIIDKYFLIKK